MPWAYYQHSSFLGSLFDELQMWSGYWLMMNGNGSSQINVTVTLVLVLSLAGYILCRAKVKWLAVIVTIGAIIAHINNFSALSPGANGASGGYVFESISVTIIGSLFCSCRPGNLVDW